MKITLVQIAIILTLIFSSITHRVNGQWLWANGQTCGRHGTGDGLGEGWLCKTDIYNNVYTGGVFSGGSHGDSICFGASGFYRAELTVNIMLNKYDSSGNVLWSLLSSNGLGAPYNIATDKAGNLYLYGYFWTDSIMFNDYLITNPYFDSTIGANQNYNSCYFILKFDTSGTPIWHKTGGKVIPYGYSLSEGDISCDGSSNIYISGTFWAHSITIGPYTLNNTHDSTMDIFVAKYDSSGNVIWANKFGGLANDLGPEIAAAEDGNSYITGTFQSPSIAFGSSIVNFTVGAAPVNSTDMYLVKLDPNGNVVWARNSIGAAIPYSISTDLSNNVYIVGEVDDSTTFTLDTLSFHDTLLQKGGFLAKYNSGGDIAWGKVICPITPYFSTGNSLWGLTTDPCDNVWISGILTGDSCYLDGTLITTTHGPYSTLFVGYRSDGTLIEGQIIPNIEDDNSSLSSDNHGNIYLSDDVTGEAILGPVTYYWGLGGEAMFTAKYNPNLTCHLNEISNLDTPHENIQLYPNPTDMTLNIISIEKIKKLTIVNIQGQLISSQKYDDTKIALDIRSLSSGLYFVKINDRIMSKFIKR